MACIMIDRMDGGHRQDGLRVHIHFFCFATCFAIAATLLIPSPLVLALCRLRRHVLCESGVVWIEPKTFGTRAVRGTATLHALSSSFVSGT
jgi:hypothetical protein